MAWICDIQTKLEEATGIRADPYRVKEEATYMHEGTPAGSRFVEQIMHPGGHVTDLGPQTLMHRFSSTRITGQLENA